MCPVGSRGATSAYRSAGRKGSFGFEWDDGNAPKIWKKHGVTPSECAQVLLARPLIAVSGTEAARPERRYYALGHSGLGRRLFVVFTLRGDRVRIISARDMSRREREVYERAERES